MSSLNGNDRRKLENLLCMNEGYVLKFSNHTFRDFFDEHGVEIEADCYKIGGKSKANRMRAFWKISPDPVVGSIISALIAYGNKQNWLPDNAILINDCRKISQRLLSNQSVVESDALTPITDEHNFEVLAKQLREAIDKNQPEVALDRLHTYVIKFIRTICKSHGINVNQDKALHSIFGEYVRTLHNGGYLESRMTERILKFSISVLEAFNDVRNDKSLAHDNQILNYEESLLIFNHIAASIRFINSLETKIKIMLKA